MTRSATVDQSAPEFTPIRLLAEARERSKVRIDEVHAFLEGDAENARLTREMLSEFAGDPVLRCGPEYYDMTKLEHREITVKKIGRLALYLGRDLKKARKVYRCDVVRELQGPDAPMLAASDIAAFERRIGLAALVDPQLATRIGVNLSLFANSVRGNGTDEQIKYWLQERGEMFLKDIYGCFAMTELGHGSNVSNLQTLATYDSDTDTFTITTPNLVATKWWIGGAAHSATHSAVYARLVVEGKDYGVKTFVVPLRDPVSMQLLPGISIGDIGSKMGRDGIDNGWIQFHGVVIPREYMLSRFTKVIPGNPPKVLVEPLLDSISGYAALLSGRVAMVMDSYRYGMRFTTIATRYAFGRQQFGDPDNETQLIDYPLHQYRVIPQIALTYVIAPGAVKLAKTYDRCLGALYSAGDDKKKLALVTSQMKDLFIESASLKATCTWLTATLIDELRQTCGGHGYSSYNGFGQGYADWVVQCTWEGDNNVLCLNSGKSLLKKFADVVRGKKVSLNDSSMDYLQMSYIQKVVMGGAKKTSNLSNLSDYYEVWSIILVKNLKTCAETVRDNNDPDSISKLLVNIAKFHCFYSLLQEYHRKLSSDDSQITDPETKEVLWKVYKLASVYFIDKFSGEFQQLKVFTPDQITNVVQKQLLSLLPDIKPHCIRLTDSFHLPDVILNSAIGNYDGDIYHNYFNDVTNVAPVDKAPGVAPYDHLLKDLLGRGFEFDRLNVKESDFNKLGK